MTLDILLYLTVFLTLGYLIYRYARYSPWRSTDAGKAFMAMKVSFFVMVTYVLVSTALEDVTGWRHIARPVVVVCIEAALLYQLATVMRLQQRNRHDAENITEEPYQPAE